ncbi:hypothetical protein EI982_02700 [Haloplanus rallus]|uniref:Uncharacterized protein n=1 Tax=Haloplanus rallus TaxID=1816183 RepID=A0A6B9F3B7_9EURY|nr:hypothetical protein [Haloplanus rallus]QGX93772.1 hypothetical protein EI982_02700 [Haloplanus rallus]
MPVLEKWGVGFLLSRPYGRRAVAMMPPKKSNWRIEKNVSDGIVSAPTIVERQNSPPPRRMICLTGSVETLAH